MKIKKGDLVKILSGKDRSKIGKVLSVLKDKEKIIVEKVNIVKRHEKQTGNQKDEGGIIEVEAPIYASKAMVICPLCNKPSRIGYKIKGKKKRRICKSCRKVF